MTLWKTLVVALVAAFTLAACSSSNNEASMEPTEAEQQATADQATIERLQAELAALREQLGLPEDGDISDSIEELQQDIADLRQEIADDAAAAARKDAEDAAAANAATAAKLYAGISAQMGAGDGTTFAATDRDAFYNADATAVLVSIGDGTNTHTAVTATLSEDKDAMIADNRGWAGKRYADPAGGDSYEAVVYSNIQDPTQGRKFGAETVDVSETTRVYEYDLTDGALPEANFVAANVAFTGVTRTAGTETFHLPENNPGGAQNIIIPGSYHGVSGNYSCNPATDTAGCSAAVAASGFTVSAGDEWSFTPTNAEARVMDAEDVVYASYGWWIRKAANDGAFAASAFVDERGTVADAENLNTLNGKATYVGGAAGKYALASSTGGTNDAGHFTARATLEADFTDNTAATAITGMLDMFVGADGQSRDWEVKLNGSAIADTGGIGDASDATDGNGPETVWTIGDMAAEAEGSWTGTLRDNGVDLVPQVATGTFYSEYGTAGKMVGAFGANKQ